MDSGIAIVVEDQVVNAELISILLKKQGMECLVMEKPSQLLTYLTNGEEIPKIIFLDLVLPEYSGYQLINLLKGDNRWSKIIVIAYTVHIDVHKVLAAGFDGCLAKPLKARDFPAILQRILNGEKVWNF